MEMLDEGQVDGSDLSAQSQCTDGVEEGAEYDTVELSMDSELWISGADQEELSSSRGRGLVHERGPQLVQESVRESRVNLQSHRRGREAHLPTPDRLRFARAFVPRPMALPHGAMPIAIHFTNGRRMGTGAAGERSWSPRLELPSAIYFFVRVKFVRVGFPFPAGIPQQFLLKVKLAPDTDIHIAMLTVDPTSVIGLAAHNMLTFCHLVLEVPSTAKVNPLLHPTKLSFHPRHGAQLHQPSAKPGQEDLQPRRLIVPVCVGGRAFPV